MQVKRPLFRADGRNRMTARIGAPLMFGFGADGQGMLPWLAQNLSALLTILVSVLLLAALAVLLFGIVREIRRNAVFLDPIDVPRALDTRGYSPAVVAERLLDALSAMQRKAPTLKELLGIESPPALVDLEVPARFSLQAIVRFIQRLVRIPESHIGGEITCEGEEFWIEDLNSTNGTRVNGVPIEKQKLVNNDQIGLGDAIVTFTLEPN